MSAPSLVLERQVAARRDLDRPAAARAVLVAGAALTVAALVLLVLVERANVAGHPGMLRTLLRAGYVVPVLALGALMLARVPRHPIGWLLCATALGSALASAAGEYAIYSHYVRELALADWAGWVSEWSSAAITLIPGVALLLFPDGRLPSRRWRPALWCGLAGTVLIALNGALGDGEDLAFQGNPLIAGETAHDLGDMFGLGWLLTFVATGAGIFALFARRRSAAGEQREQLRLLFGAGTAVAVGFLACGAGGIIAPAAFDAGAIAALTSLAVLAVTMAVAILRHRLYGLDVYVDRALVLAGVTLVLGALYVGAVLLAGEIAGQDVPLGVALPATALVAIAFQPVREHLQRSVNRLLHGQRDEPYEAIATLGRRLGEAMAPADVLPVMVETIAEALRLPFAAVELAGEDGPAAVYGVPAAGIALRLPLSHRGERVGSLLLGARAHGEPLGHADRRLLEDFARPASAAVSAVALSREVQHARERLVSAREEERRRLRGDLHDGLGPRLAGAMLSIEAAQRVLEKEPARADALLDGVADGLAETLADVRRLVYGLRPPALDQLGLAGALRQQAQGLSDGRLRCDVVLPEPLPELPAAVEVAVFKIAQEALMNVVRHACASTATLSLTVGDRGVLLELRDDGRGLPPEHHRGVGLTSMRERATELGGSLDVESAAGGGTVVRARLPLAGVEATSAPGPHRAQA